MNPALENEYAHVFSANHNVITKWDKAAQNISVQLKNDLDNIFASGKQVVSYGAGSYAANVSGEIKLLDNTLFLGFIDSDSERYGESLASTRSTGLAIWNPLPRTVS